MEEIKVRVENNSERTTYEECVCKDYRTPPTNYCEICYDSNFSIFNSDINQKSQMVLLENIFKLIQSGTTNSKEQIPDSLNDIRTELKLLKSSLNDTTMQLTSQIKVMTQEIGNMKVLLSDIHSTKIKYCIICRVNERLVKCSICNFKSCNSCYESCMICNKNFCLNCIITDLRCKVCKNGVCKECHDHSPNINRVLEFCSCCNQPYCKLKHKLELCLDCNKPSCSNCLRNCSCQSLICKNCYNRTSYNSNCINDSKLNCIHNESLLVGCGAGKVISFNPTEMKMIEDYSLGLGNGFVNNILLINNKTVTGTNPGKVSIWNDRKLRSLNYDLVIENSNDIQHLRDNLIAISNFRHNRCVLVNYMTHETLHEYSLNNYPNTLCKANDTFMLVGCLDGIIKLWNTDNNTMTDGINAHLRCVNSIIKINRTNEQFMSSGNDGLIKLWTIDDYNKNIIEITNKRITKTSVVQHNWSRLKELKDGRIVQCTKDNSISIWDINSLTNICLKSHSNMVFDFFELEHNLILSCSGDMTIKKWDLRKYEIPCENFNYIQWIFRFQSNIQDKDN